MQVIHFTAGATDPLKQFRAGRTGFVPLADGWGDVHVSCLHLSAGARVCEPPVTHASTLLVVHGVVTFTAVEPRVVVEVFSGMGVVTTRGERYSLETSGGAIVMVVEAPVLEAHARGVSTPARIAGQRWPGEALPRWMRGRP
jgi:hypothetical protein